MKKFFLSAVASLLLVFPVCAQSYSIDWHTMEGGGISIGSGYSLNGAFGQVEAGSILSGGNYSLASGVLGILAADRPADQSITIFDNTGGSENGGSGITATTWLAGRFCLGGESYSLDSVSVLLNSQDYSGAAGPPSVVRLQIYANDPASGKPAASIGPILNLTDQTNPIALRNGQQLVRWSPITLFRLQTNTCYWAVISAQDGVRMGVISSFTRPTGEAGSFGAAVSIDGGAHWQSPGYSGNIKMLILGTPLSPSPTLVFTAVSLAGKELLLSFPTLSAASYVLESRADLVAGEWTPVPGAAILGDGTTWQMTVSTAQSAPHHFFRLKQLP